MTISAAHFVHTADSDSPCRRLHGHNWKITVIIDFEGDLSKRDGMIVDFRKLKELVMVLDHKVLIPVDTILLKGAGEYEVEHNGKRYVFPEEDCIVIDVPAITSEYIANWLSGMIAFKTDISSYRVNVIVEETEGSIVQSEVI